MYFTTNRRWSYAVVWCFWFLVLLTVAWHGGPPWVTAGPGGGNGAGRHAWPCSSCHRRHPVRRGRGSRRAAGASGPWPGTRRRSAPISGPSGRRAGRGCCCSGALTMAAVVDWLTRAQLRRQLGALPVLYRLLEILDVRRIINRHCPSATQVDHGAVVVVLVLNRLMAPRPLYKVADWLGQTVLVTVLGIPAAKFNDDRLGRTLDAIAAHQRDIWLDIVSQALRRFQHRLALPVLRSDGPGGPGRLYRQPVGRLRLCPQHAQRQAKGQARRHRQCRWRHPGGLCRPRRPDGRSGDGAREHGPPVPALGTSRPAVVRGAADW